MNHILIKSIHIFCQRIFPSLRLYKEWQSHSAIGFNCKNIKKNFKNPNMRQAKKVPTPGTRDITQIAVHPSMIENVFRNDSANSKNIFLIIILLSEKAFLHFIQIVRRKIPFMSLFYYKYGKNAIDCKNGPISNKLIEFIQY